MNQARLLGLATVVRGAGQRLAMGCHKTIIWNNRPRKARPGGDAEQDPVQAVCFQHLDAICSPAMTSTR